MSSQNTLTRWRIRYREARTHAVITACLLSISAAVLCVSPGDRYLTGELKGGDFIHFYTLGHLAFQGVYPGVKDFESMYSHQVQLLPASSPNYYLPVYPPQTGILFAPLSLLPYRAAATLWMLVVMITYGAIVSVSWKTVQDALRDRVFVAAAAAAFPPIWFLALNGQTTILPLLAFFLGWLALRSNRKFLAGLAFGLLSIKPQFALVLACVVLFTAQWRILLGGLCSVSIQLSAAAGIFGIQALSTYIVTIKSVPQLQSFLEPKPWRMHSFRSITNLIPDMPGTLLWLLISAMVIAVVVSVWRMRTDYSVGLGLTVLGSVLVSPHLFMYDTTVLVLPLIWLGGFVERERPTWRTEYWHCVYFLFVFLLFPTARFLQVQFSVLLMAWLFWRVASHVHTSSRHAAARDRCRALVGCNA
jgi:Glycosyltransferase family 87